MGGQAPAMQYKLEHQNMSNKVHVEEISLAALRRARAMLDDRTENERTKKPLMEHLRQ